MKRKTILLASTIWLAFASSLLAQRIVDVSVVEAKATTTKIVVTETVLLIDGETSLVSESSPGQSVESTSQVGRIRIEGDPVEGVQIQAFNSNFEPAEIETLSGFGRWIIRKPGRYLVAVYIPGEYVPIRPLIVPGIVDPVEPINPVEPVDPVPVITPPIDGEGFQVLVVYQTEDLARYPASQREIFYSPDVRDWLDSASVKVDGLPSWRFQDADTQFQTSNRWSKAIQRPRSQLPWVIISNGKTGFEGPLPATASETIQLLEKYVVIQ